MVADLQQENQLAKPKSQHPLQVTSLCFEKHMNNDFDVKSAFDSLYETVSELHKRRRSLSEKNLKNTLSELHKIDNVLQCIF
jgi:cysteinyl-tRNA synthetase